MTKKEFVVAWNHQHIKVFRLDTELSPARVLGQARYENSVGSSTFNAERYFPFDIMNLDFSSQDPDFLQGRIEREIKSVEDTIRIQNQKACMDFVLFYTTLFDSTNLSYQQITLTSNSVYVPSWPGLSISQFPANISEQSQKMLCIEAVLQMICRKYNYTTVQAGRKHIPVLGQSKDLFSLATRVTGRS